MKTKSHWVALAGMLVMTVACKEKLVEIDSPYITVTAPKHGQVVNDKDSVRIRATIKPVTGSVKSYSMTVKGKNGKILYSGQRGCDCKSKDSVDVRTSFYYDINKTSDVVLEIIAMLEDGSEIVEKVPFVLADQ